MPGYDGERFDPPAPVAHVTLRNPASGQTISDIPMLLDTGADISLIPLFAAERLGATIELSTEIGLLGYDGSETPARCTDLQIHVFGGKAEGRFAVLDQPCGIIGRDILNLVALNLDGPNRNWSMSDHST